MTREPGVHANVPEDEYHPDPLSLSTSGAKLLLPPNCPAKFKEAQDNPPPPTTVFDYGHLAHTLVLGAGQELAVLDPAIHGLKKDGTPAESPRATADWKAADAEARARGALPVHVDDHDRAQLMAKLVRDDPVAGPLFIEGTPELSLYADDPMTGVRLRARPDWMTMIDGRVTLVEYKTSEDASPWRFGRRAYDYGYHLQNAWYWTVARLLEIDSDPDMVFVVQEKKPPYLVSVVRLDSPAFLLGIGRMRAAIELYAQCAADDHWPGYSDRIETVSLPPWTLNNTTTSED